MSVTAYPTLRLKLTMPTALKLQFLPAVPGFNASQAAALVENKVNRPGDTMTGFLTANANPTAPLHYATKGYVDTAIAGSGGGSFLPLAGGTLTGDLTINKDSPAVRLNTSTDGPDYIAFQNNFLVRWYLSTTGGTSGDDINFLRFDNAGTGIDAPFNLSRSTGELTLTKPLSLPLLPGNPTLPQHSATKQYVDSKAGRTVLTAGRTYFIRTDGSDSNTGLTNTAGGAFATIQKGIDAACALDLSTFNVTIKVVDGTYNITGTAMRLKTYVGAGPISIVGNTTSPQNVIVNTTTGDTIAASAVMGQYNIAGFTLKCNTAGYVGCRASGGPTFINLQDIRWDTALFHVFSDYGSQLFCIGTQAIIGDANAHMLFTNKGIIQNTSKTITLVGTRKFAGGFAVGNQNGLLVANALVFSGPVPGPVSPKVSNASLGLIMTGSGDVNYFPGDTPGTTWAGGYF